MVIVSSEKSFSNIVIIDPSTGLRKRIARFSLRSSFRLIYMVKFILNFNWIVPGQLRFT